nr:hypothetical protein [Tanacetum cinerariifolium]
EYYGKLILDFGNEVCSSVEQGMAAMKKLVEKLGNVEDKAECKKLNKELKEARPNEAIDVSIEDEKSPSFEPRGSAQPQDVTEVENMIEHKDETIPASVHEVVCSSVEQGMAAMKKLVEKLGNVEDKAECKKLNKELEEARPNEAIDVPIEDEKSPSFEPRGSAQVDPLNPPPPASESEPRDVTEVENMIEYKDETIPASVHEVGESSTALFL